MKKVYCIFFDYSGYEEQLQAIYEKKKDAIERLMAYASEYEYGDIADYMRESELSLVEWEVNTNVRRVIKLSEFV